MEGVIGFSGRRWGPSLEGQGGLWSSCPLGGAFAHSCRPCGLGPPQAVSPSLSFPGAEQSPEGRAEWHGAVQHGWTEESASPRPVSFVPQGQSPASSEQPWRPVERVTEQARVSFSECVRIQLCFSDEAELHDFTERSWYLGVAQPCWFLPAAEGIVKKKTKENRSSGVDRS